MKDLLSSVSPKGQVTIPAEIRQMLGVRPRDKVAFRVTNGQVQIVPTRVSLDAIYGSVPPLGKSLSEKEVTTIASEEHASHVAQEGR